eukprot:6789066-Pyramimonas_sp.AAC.1
MPDYSFYVCLQTFTLVFGMTIGVGIFVTLWATMRQNTAMATEESVAEAKVMGEHPGWGGRMLGRRRNIPPTIPEDRDHDDDIAMSHADVFSSAQASSSVASAAIQ